MKVGILSIILSIGYSICVAQQDTNEHTFNYILGTQTFGASYGFTNDSRLLETAKAIEGMGSNIIKFHLKSGIDGTNHSPKYEDLDSLIELEPTMQFIFDSLAFKDYFMWVRSFNHWYNGYTQTEKSGDSIKIYNLTRYLLQKYQGTGKQFFIGHWEGDWYLLGGYNINAEPSDFVIQNMRKWLQNRQDAIDQAKRDYPVSDVNVFHYTEVNRVMDAYAFGKKRLVNEVLPYVNVDYVSYSAYDVQTYPQQNFEAVLDYIEGFLQPKTMPTTKRVFIGEFGRPARAVSFNDSFHEEVNRQIFRKALKWCSPYIMYWEMYNNEIDNGQQVGYWLINDRNEKTALYTTMSFFYKSAKNWVHNFKIDQGRLPNTCEYSVFADSLLSEPINAVVIERKENPQKAYELFKVFPNPSPNGHFMIQGLVPGYQFALYLTNGQKILDGETNDAQAEFSVTTAGVYVLRIIQDNESYFFKLIF